MQIWPPRGAGSSLIPIWMCKVWEQRKHSPNLGVGWEGEKSLAPILMHVGGGEQSSPDPDSWGRGAGNIQPWHMERCKQPGPNLGVWGWGPGG